jgi:hypothetical protein
MNVTPITADGQKRDDLYEATQQETSELVEGNKAEQRAKDMQDNIMSE